MFIRGETMKKEVLELLNRKKGVPVSGLAIGKQLGVSRNAVWKAVNQLKKEGYDITSIPNKGYMLSVSSDILDIEVIQSHLKTKQLGREMKLLPVVDSTNNYLKRKANELPDGFAILSQKQTGGRGRMERHFYSPPQSGIYMSFIIRLHRSFDAVSLLTVIAAVSVAQAIKQTAGFEPEIKWVNDVLYRGKKLCGILTEASIEAETGLVDYAIVGIGINVSGVAEEIKEIAGYINEFSSLPCSRNLLAAAVLNQFEELYLSYAEQGNRAKIINNYRQLLNVFGKEYDIISPRSSYPATPIDIDEDARLIVRDQNGRLHTVHSGEISIRPKL